MSGTTIDGKEEKLLWNSRFICEKHTELQSKYHAIKTIHIVEKSSDISSDHSHVRAQAFIDSSYARPQQPVQSGLTVSSADEKSLSEFAWSTHNRSQNEDTQDRHTAVQFAPPSCILVTGFSRHAQGFLQISLDFQTAETLLRFFGAQAGFGWQGEDGGDEPRWKVSVSRPSSHIPVSASITYRKGK